MSSPVTTGQEEQAGHSAQPPDSQEGDVDVQTGPAATRDAVRVKRRAVQKRKGPPPSTGPNRSSPRLVKAKTAPPNKPPANLVQQGKTCCRCSPKDVIEAIKIMSGPQKDRIHALGWGKILDITIDAVETRALYMWLLTKVDAINMELRVRPDTALPINKHAVHTVMGVPPGTRTPQSHSRGEVNAERYRLAEALGCKDGEITINRLKDKLREHSADDLSIRCFFLILFNRLLFPTTSFNICNREVEYTIDFEVFAEVDWQQAMIDDIQRTANWWNSSEPKPVNRSLSSCLLFLIIYYLDNLAHSENNENRMTTPRAALFTKEKVRVIMTADRQRDAKGNTTFGRLPLKSQTGSTYNTICPPAAQPGLSATFDLPVFSELLHGYTGRVTRRKADQITKLIATFDTDICHNQRAISELYQAKIKCMEKFGDDVRALLDGPIRSEGDTDTEGPTAGEAENHEVGCGNICQDIHSDHDIRQDTRENQDPLAMSNILPERAPPGSDNFNPLILQEDADKLKAKEAYATSNPPAPEEIVAVQEVMSS